MNKIGEFRTELARKGIHIFIALVPLLAAADRPDTVLLLMAGVLFYACAESMRFLGIPLPLISVVTAAVSRKRERFALGPLTLGLGAILALLIFPPPAAAAAIYALAFGDSASVLIGRFLGRIRPAFLSGKSLEGIMACFIAASISGYLVYGNWRTALAVGLASLLVDTLPIGDFDNILMPLAAGLGAIIFAG